MELMKKNICVKCGNGFVSDLAAATICPNCSISGNDIPPGTILNGYEIIQTLGYGGMGTVYLAEQKSMQRRVALKILNPSVTRDAAAVEQFLNEVRNTGSIHHPNIVNAFDAGCEGGIYYLAMQYINGTTLDHIIQEGGAMNEIKALEIINQVSGALAYVWGKYQMYHRDIKPGNIMIDDENKAMLMDLGIAQKLGEGNGMEESVEGSPYYMSPEQIQGKELSWTTDLYSLGATLYQMITGVPPYDDKSIEEILQKHCLAEFPEPAERNPAVEISPETVNFIRQMMNKTPGGRFASWAEFIQKLNQLINLLKDYEVNPVRRLQRNAIATAEENRRRIQRNKTMASRISLIVSIVIILLLAGGYFFLTMKNKEAAAVYLTEGDQNILAVAYAEFLANPAQKKEQLDEALRDAENAATSMGVPEEDTRIIMDTVKNYKNQEKLFYDKYMDFERFAYERFKSNEENIQTRIMVLNGKSRLTFEDCKVLRDLINNVKLDSDRQKPVSPLHKKRLDQIKVKISSWDKSARDFENRLKQQNEAEAKARSSQYTQSNLAEQQRVKEDKQRELSQNAQKIKAEVAKKAAMEQKEEAQRIAKMNAAAMRKPVVKKAPEKKGPVKLSNNKLALPEIKKAQLAIKLQFMQELAIFRFNQAAAIKLPPELLELKLPTHDRAVNTEMAKLNQIYKEYHEQSAAAAKCWNMLNDQKISYIFNGESVRKTNINRNLQGWSLRIDKIKNGNVYFKESGSNPEKFIDLSMRDKIIIAERLVRVQGISLEDSRHFYFSLGLFKSAFDVCPDNETKQLIAKIKEMVKFQYTYAKKRKDTSAMNRMKRDYGNNKMLKGLLR